MSKESGLGMGLGALFGSVGTEPEEFVEGAPAPVNEIPIDLIDNDAAQPRRVFDDEKLQELAQSIRAHGIMQPLLVTPAAGGRYRIIAGERRFRAAKLAQLSVVPVVVRQVQEGSDTLELALIENIQREDLNPIEQSEALRRLVKEYGMKQEEIAEHVGKSRSAIANLMRLSHLPDSVRDMVSQGIISAGHARALLPLEDPTAIENVAKWIIKNDMSVRQTEEMVRRTLQEGKEEDKPAKQPLPPEVKEAQQSLSAMYDTKVRIVGSESKGKITIDYYSKEQLNNLYEALSKK